MNLDYDCAFDVLREISKRTGYDASLQIVDADIFEISEALPKWELAQIAFTLEMLEHEKLIKAAFSYANDSLDDCAVKGLTPKGEKLLINLTPKTAREKIKTAALKLGGMTLQTAAAVLEQIAIEKRK